MYLPVVPLLMLIVISLSQSTKIEPRAPDLSLDPRVFESDR